MRRTISALSLVLGLGLALTCPPGALGQTAPSGELTFAWHVTLAPSWFDPSTAPPQITPYGILYALHDGLVRPLPGQKIGASLAESWKESPDGLTYEFRMRRGLTFHNGEPVTLDDVKFSFERYKGAGAKELQARVRQLEIVDPHTIRFHLKEAWPDFLTFYGTPAGGAGLVVPRKYLERVGDDGFRKHPIGAGPYRFVSHRPGVEIVLEAFTAHWRKVPHVKRLVMKSVPETTSRVAMLKGGEADVAFAVDGEDALNVKRDPRLSLIPSKHASIFWIEFADQWDPKKSPWHDRRVRLAVNHALNRTAINEAACLGFCPPTGTIVPRVLEFALQVPPPAWDVRKAKQLLAEAGFPNGLDAGDFTPIPPFAAAEAMVNDLKTAGIRVKMRPMERAAFIAAWREKKLRGLFFTAAGNAGNAASRVEAFIYSKGSFAYGGYPDIDDLFQQQARERDVAKREALLHRIQQLAVDRVMFAPIMDFRTLRGVGPRVAEHALDTLPLVPYPAYEDMKLKTP